MRNLTKTPLIVSILAAGLLAVSSLYAHEHNGSQGSKAGGDMMGHGGMMGMMGGGGMMGMMGKSSSMMNHCANMMQGGDNGGNRPNEQWRKPGLPDKGN
ncbi:MAG: hypothetical protein HY659_02460 [Rhizobiales bacterium]|nr:hypothetical protein [Hyphomicrobiales bacterium]